MRHFNPITSFMLASLTIISCQSIAAQQIEITCFQDNTNTPTSGDVIPFVGDIEVTLSARRGAIGGSSVNQSTIRWTNLNNLTPQNVVTVNANKFRVKADATGSFQLIFNAPSGTGQSFPNAENQLEIQIDGGGGVRLDGVSARIDQIATGDVQNLTVVLNGAPLQNTVGLRSLAGPGVNEAFSVGSSTFLLTEDSGTALFQSQSPAVAVVRDGQIIQTRPAPQFQIQSLELSGGSDNYIFYREKDSDGRYWAFAKSPTSVCKCVDGRWVLVRNGHKIYYWNRRVSKRWIFFGYGDPKNPVCESNALR